MDYCNSKILEVYDSLMDLYSTDLYSSAVGLFKILNYPVESIQEFSNLTLSKFLELLGKDEKYINSSEVIPVSEIEAVSLLFVLNNQIKELKHVREYNDGIFLGQSIIVIGVDLSENESSYEYTIPAITNFFNRLINTQILILFRRKDKICFSVKRRRINKKDETQDAKGSNFQTDWICIYPPSEEAILKITEISFDELRDENFYFMYNDLVACIASEYFIEDFPTESNISSHIKINDGIALYLRDIGNLCNGCDIVNTELLNNDLSFEKKDDENGSDMEVLERIQELFESSANKTTNKDMDDNLISISNFEDELSDNILEEKCSNVDKAINILNDKCSKLGGETMESKKVQDIHNNLSSLISSVEALKEYYREKRKNEPENLSIDELQKYVYDLVDKTKAAESFKNEIVAVRDKFNTAISDFSSVISELNDLNINEKKDMEDKGANNACQEGEVSTIGESYVFTTPYKLLVLGTEYGVDTWTDVLVMVCEEMIKKCPEKAANFDKNPKLSGRSRVYFSYDESKLTKSAKQLSNQLYIETNFSADSIYKLCKEIISECGFASKDVEIFVNKKQSKIIELETDLINSNKEAYVNFDKEILDEIKFPLKYGSISVKVELLKTFLKTISEFSQHSKRYFEIYDLKMQLLDYIKKNSPYKQPEHVFNNILKFLIEWEVISLFEGSKRGKYIVKDNNTLQEMINDTKMIVGLLMS